MEFSTTITWSISTQIKNGTPSTWLVGELGGAPNIYVTGLSCCSTRYPYSNNGSATTPGAFVCDGNGWSDEMNGDHWLQGNTSDGMNPG